MSDGQAAGMDTGTGKVVKRNRERERELKRYSELDGGYGSRKKFNTYFGTKWKKWREDNDSKNVCTDTCVYI